MPSVFISAFFMVQNGKIKVLSVLKYTCEWDDDVLVDEYEQEKKKTQSDGTQRAHSRQFIE